MKKLFVSLLLTALFYLPGWAQTTEQSKVINFDTIKIGSHINGLNVALLHLQPKVMSGKIPVLFIHGSSFPSSLSFGFRMGGYSWMDKLSDNGFESFALDFLGYGNSDRYPAMYAKTPDGKPVGRAADVYHDIDCAINYILKQTGSKKVYLVAHSWGGSVAALYASKFPGKIERLVLFAPITEQKTTGLSEVIAKSYDEMTPQVRVDAMESLTPAGKVSTLEPEIKNEWKKHWIHSDPLVKDFILGSVRYPAGPEQDIEDMQHGKSYYDPSLIKVPVLIVRGEWDDYPSNQDAGTLFSNLTNAPLKKYAVLEKGTHVMHLEKTRGLLYQEVLNFIFDGVPINNVHQIAVIFEVIPREGEKQEYLDIAAKLKPMLVKIDGFISIERFQSLTDPYKILSLSFWRDEKAIEQWRNVEMHRDAQTKGRSYVFKDYHLRIADVVRNYGMFDRKEAPADSKKVNISLRN